MISVRESGLIERRGRWRDAGYWNESVGFEILGCYLVDYGSREIGVVYAVIDPRLQSQKQFALVESIWIFGDPAFAAFQFFVG